MSTTDKAAYQADKAVGKVVSGLALLDAGTDLQAH